MNIEDRESYINRLLQRIQDLAYGIGMPEILLQDFIRAEKELKKYRKGLKSPDYIGRVDILLDALNKKKPDLEARAKVEKEKRQLHIERKQGLANPTSDLPKSHQPPKIQRRIPPNLGLRALFSRHSAKPAQLVKN